jgi:hypothetical protein
MVPFDAMATKGAPGRKLTWQRYRPAHSNDNSPLAAGDVVELHRCPGCSVASHQVFQQPSDISSERCTTST